MRFLRKLTYGLALLAPAGGLLAQNSGIAVDEPSKDIGQVEQVYKISAEYVLQNNLAKNLYLLRADAEKGITIRSSKKSLKPSDTALLTVEFIPQSTGRFSKPVKLVTSADGEPYLLALSGTIKSIRPDDKTACFYFRKPVRNTPKADGPIVVRNDDTPRDVTNKIPDGSTTTLPPPTEKEPEPVRPVKPVEPVNDKLLDAKLYKTNNIVFVVDVSNSMKDSLKLPVMKTALHALIEALRPNDRITFITYADTVKLLKENVSGANKEELDEVVDRLKAKGLTKGNKAILYGLEVALKNYIPGGNNQIILATDGKFRFYSEDQQKFVSRQADNKVVLSTVAFGSDREAMDNLKDIARIGKGDFIHIKNKSKAREMLLDEIRDKSLIR